MLVLFDIDAALLTGHGRGMRALTETGRPRHGPASAAGASTEADLADTETIATWALTP